MQPTQHDVRRGFTLIELLVVIAIISILAAILFPVFARARENARRASCLSNLKQIGIGMMMYTQDYDEKYPLVFWDGGGTGEDAGVTQTDPSMPGYKYGVSNGAFGWDGAPPVGGAHWVTWMDMIFPYVKSTQLFDCPSASNTKQPSYGFSSAFSGNQSSYYTAYAVISGSGGISMAAINRPAEIYLLIDYNSQYGIYANPVDVQAYVAANRTSGNMTVARHFGGGNVMFADGHVKWQSGPVLEDVGTVNTYPDWACNPDSPDYSHAYCDLNWNPYIK